MVLTFNQKNRRWWHEYDVCVTSTSVSDETPVEPPPAAESCRGRRTIIITLPKGRD